MPLPTCHLQVLIEVAQAIQHLHAMKLIHCDIKPENVLLKVRSQFSVDGGVLWRAACCAAPLHCLILGASAASHCSQLCLL